METFGLSELARRSGQLVTTLHYYEKVGLIVPVARSERGHRLYDATTVQRLGFVDEARAVGACLNDIAGLVELWEGGVDEPVRNRLVDTADARLRFLRAEVALLLREAAELEADRARVVGGDVPTRFALRPCAQNATRALRSAEVVVIDFGAPQNGHHDEASSERAGNGGDGRR